MSENKNQMLGPVKNPDLEKVLQEIKGGYSPEKQLALSEELKKAHLLSPCDIKLPAGAKPGMKVKPESINFFLLNTKDGKTFFPVFTNFENSTKMKFGNGQVSTIVRELDDYAKMVENETKASGILINPGIDNIVVPKNLIFALTGRIKKEAPKPNPIRVQTVYSEPHVYPTRMVSAVYDLCEGKEEVRRVWLKQKTIGPMMSFLLIVEADTQNESLLKEIKIIAEPLAKKVPLELVFYSEEIEEKIIKDATPLYDREMAL